MKQCKECGKWSAGNYMFRKKTDQCHNCYHKNKTQEYRDRNVNGVKRDVFAATKRQCLMCDCFFISTGNRRCPVCNQSSRCQYESEISLWVRC